MSKPTTIPFRVVDIEKARTVLGWEPRVTLEQGLADTTKYQENRELRKAGINILRRATEIMFFKNKKVLVTGGTGMIRQKFSGDAH